MRIGSLFSGIGGLELGLEWAGVGHTVFQVERDPYASSILAKHWPDALRFDDVCTVGAHNLPAVDVICGGFPCQDISVSGKGAGLDGARSGLWREFARIIGEVRPRFVVLENVANLLTIDNGRGFGTVLGDLAALGFDAWWDCLPASAVGAAHRRDRTFVVAYPAGARLEGIHGQSERIDLQPIAPHVRRQRKGQSRLARRDDGLSCGVERFPATRDEEPTKWEPPRIATRRATDKDRRRVCGNAVVPQVAYVVGRVVMQIATNCGPRAAQSEVTP